MPVGVHLRCRAATVDRRASTYAQRAPVDRSEDTILRSPESIPEVPVGVPPSLQGSYGGQACFHLRPEGSGGQVGGYHPSLT